MIKENLLQDVYTRNPDLFYRRADGFTTMIKHPTLPPKAIEGLQRHCFKEDFRRLGPSIFRVLETRLLGCRKLSSSPNPRLRQKAECFAKDLRAAYPAFLVGRLLGPNRVIRHWIGGLERRVHAVLGRPTLRERLKSWLAVGAGLWTAVTLKLNLFQHPQLTRTTYRLPGKRWASLYLWEELRSRASIPGLSIQVDLQPARQQVWLRLEGRRSRAEAKPGPAHP